MLSGELRAGIRTTSVLLFITAGLIVAAAVKNAIGDSKLFFLQSEIIILLLSIVNLLLHLYSYRQLYRWSMTGMSQRSITERGIST